MARKAGGADQLASAQTLLRKAKTADELRAAQAVALPLELGLSLAQTAKAIGRSVGATCNPVSYTHLTLPTNREV